MFECLRVFGHVGFFRSVFSTTSSNRSHHHEWQDRRGKRPIKEAAGALTGNDKLRAEGRTDQAIGKVKQIATKTVARVGQAVKKVRE